jgi:hypothetical protein
MACGIGTGEPKRSRCMADGLQIGYRAEWPSLQKQDSVGRFWETDGDILGECTGIEQK